MESPQLFPLAPFLRGRGRRIIFGLHDPEFHPGEWTWFKAAARFAGISCSDGLLTWSKAAQTVVRQRLRSSHMPCFASVHGAYGEPVSEPRSLKPEGPVTLAFFGRIQPYKGVDLLLSAVQMLEETAAGRYQLVIYGEGRLPSDPDPATMSQVEVHNRWVEDAEVSSILRGVDIMVLPYVEASQSGVLALAMAAGVPSVVTPVGGLAEQINGSGAGVVAGSVSAEAVADAVRTLAEDPERYRGHSAAGRAAAVGEFSWERVAADVEMAARSVQSRAPVPLLARLRAAAALSGSRPV
jgi:glycosyltransferase involved in cell wall biosynthesis